MTHLSILLAQSVTGAVLTIVGLLLVAAIIGYLAAWFYAKSVYTPIIKGLEAEKADLQKLVTALKEEIKMLNDNIAGLKTKIEDIEKDIAEKNKMLGEKDQQINELKNQKKQL